MHLFLQMMEVVHLLLEVEVLVVEVLEVEDHLQEQQEDHQMMVLVVEELEY